MQEYRYEGESIARSILYDLVDVHSKEDLILLTPSLKKKFSKLTDLMLIANKYHKNHSEDEENEEIDHRISDALKEQFIRIYQIDGCQEVMEEIQRDSVHRLNKL